MICTGAPPMPDDDAPLPELIETTPPLYNPLPPLMVTAPPIVDVVGDEPCLWNNSVPLIYSGQELPNKKRLNFFTKDQIDWTFPTEFHNFYKKLQPLLLNAENGGGSWKAHGIRRGQVLQRMDPIRTALPEIWPEVMAVVDHACAEQHILP